jgi:hypothetical protein
MRNAILALLVAGMIAALGCSGDDVPKEQIRQVSSALEQGELKLQYHHGEDPSATDNEIEPYFRIRNLSGAVVSLSELKIRY